MWRWYVVYTKPLGEQTAQSNLERQGYEVYFPRLLQAVRRRQRWLDRISPLFPRYLFLRLDEGRQSLQPVHSTLSVSAVVRFGSRYAVVPDRIITNLRTRAEGESGLHRLRRQSPLVPDTSLIITEGAFEGLEGVFKREVGSDRVVILLKMLGHEAQVRIPAGAVAPTHRAA